MAEAKAVRKKPAAKAAAKAVPQDDLAELVRKQQEEIEKLKAALASAAPPQVVVAEKEAPRVMLLWMAPVADENVVTFGPNGMYGRITGKTGSFWVPHDSLSQILDSATRGWIDRRWLIVVSGIDDEEREALGCLYRTGEVLDRTTFTKMLDMGAGLAEVYENLCESHKEMVAKITYDAYTEGRFRDKETVLMLNNIKPQESFRRILAEMSEDEIK